MRITPKASVTVTQMGSPSGIAATARETPMLNMDIKDFPCITPIMPMHTIMPREKTLSFLPNSSIFICSGERRLSIPFISWKVFPNSVSTPVPTTTAVPCPAHTSVLIKRIFDMSLMSVSSPISGRGSEFFSFGSVSPVRQDSSRHREEHCSTLASAGTLSPLLNTITSPGTNSSARMFFVIPPRMTLHLGGTSVFSAASDCSDLYSW
mmetsp:Transcript_33995/g.74879  ORF Transcript_33995/g.74879 Transcript_33995/m.74879 type:complete len:208 (-) Transcript_33995:382-1005(-)